MQKKFLLLIVLGLLGMAACRKNDLGSTATPVNLTLNIVYEEEVQALELPKTDALIKITNLSSGTVKEATTNEEGVAVFESLPPGTYTITASITIDADTYSSLSGTIVTEDVVFNGNLTGKSVTDAITSIEIPVVAGRLGNWVFKQVYYAGSNTSEGASFRDQFFEVYNNSNEVMYADSLYFAQVYGVNSTTNKYPDAGYQSSGQYDWAQSIGMTSASANEEYVYVKSIYMIPGTGTSVPVQPGESIIVAQTALNHTAPYTTNSGTVQGITNPDLTVDLSGADFEGYLVDYLRALSADPSSYSAYKWDVDNPGVPNLDVVFVTGAKEMLLDNLGRDAFVLFQPTGVDPRTWPSFPLPTQTSVDNETTVYPQVPISYVIDAVELERVVETQRLPKRLQNALDAGPTHVEAGEYTSQSLVRKTARTVDGRIILQDTNNSANDFVTKTKADPSKSAASFAN